MIKDFFILLQYLFSRPFTFRALFCRFRNHPAGYVWNSSGLEPNYHCSGCGDDLG